MPEFASRIAAFGHYQPARVVTNAELASQIDTDEAWILSRVGIATRHLAEHESVASMAAAAAAKALANAQLDTAEVDLIIVATSSELVLVSVAVAVAAELGLTHALAYDLNTACSGFTYALATADQAIRAGTARNALVIGSERYSDVIDWTDRGTCVIFADGAGAAVLRQSSESGIGPVVWGSVPELRDAVVLEGEKPLLRMQGQAVFRWATTMLPGVALEACRRAGIRPKDLAAFVPHQANLRIINSMASQLGLAPTAIVADDIVGAGNTAAASIPLALSKLAERGDLPSGAPALLIGFGAGLTYAAQVIALP